MEMEKEQKKLLLVAVSVGVFLLVTITVAIMILTPKVQTNDSVFSASNLIQAGRIQTTEYIEPVNNQETIIIDTRPDIAIASDRNDGDNLTIQIPRPTTAAVPDTPEPAPARVQTTPVAESTTQPATVQPTTTQRPAATAQPAAQPRTTTVSRPVASPARLITDYWVQAGAFAAIIRAEDARDHLASKGLTSIIENREIEGRTWYRVRMGPYTSENEANYWLALVKEIDGFDNSQVRQTTRQQ
jgi:DedD protein